MGVTFGGVSQFLGATLLMGLFQIARSLACLFGPQRPILTGAAPAPPGQATGRLWCARARLWVRRARAAIARPPVPAFSAAEPSSQSPSAAAWQAARMMLNSDRRIQHFIERASARSEMLTVIYPYVL